MAWRVCSTPGCPEVHQGSGKCPACRREADAARGTRAERGYGRDHIRERRTWEPKVAAGGVACRRCEEPIEPGEAWDLGHPDAHCAKPKAPEHERCNRATNGRAVA